MDTTDQLVYKRVNVNDSDENRSTKIELESEVRSVFFSTNWTQEHLS